MMLDTPTDPSRNITISSLAHKKTTIARIVRCSVFSITTNVFLINVFMAAILSLLINVPTIFLWASICLDRTYSPGRFLQRMPSLLHCNIRLWRASRHERLY